MIHSKILNLNNTGLEQYPLFFGDDLGLHNTVNKQYPKVWEAYKELKSLDWNEDEFEYALCNADFKRCSKDIKDMMIETLAMQWGADTVASRSVTPILAPFISSSELWSYVQLLGANETVHANTYSEVIRMSFDNPDEVLTQILEMKQSFARIEDIAKVFEEAYIASHKYALGMIEYDQDVYNIVYKVWVALLMLERIEFIASFAITFTICESGVFTPIGDAVQLIARDELESHAATDMLILNIENQTERGKTAKKMLEGEIIDLFHAVVDAELQNVDYIFRNGRVLAGTNADIVKKWVLFNAKHVAKFLEIETKYTFPAHNPMPSMNQWLDVNKIQGAPQEGIKNPYKAGIITRDDVNASFVIDF